MGVVEHTVEIDRAPAEVFAVVSDFQGSPRWQPNVLEETVSPEGPVGIGTQVRQRRKFMGMTVESTSEITAWESDRKIETTSLPAVNPSVITRYEQEPAGDGTRLHFRIELNGGRFFTLFEPVVMWTLRRDVRERFQRLKEMLEEQG